MERDLYSVLAIVSHFKFILLYSFKKGVPHEKTFTSTKNKLGIYLVDY